MTGISQVNERTQEVGHRRFVRSSVSVSVVRWAQRLGSRHSPERCQGLTVAPLHCFRLRGDADVKGLFFLVRLPFFLVGLVLVILLSVVFGGPVFLYYFALRPICRLLFVAPFKFLSAAFANDREILTAYLRRIDRHRRREVRGFLSNLWGVYSRLGLWLVHGTRKEQSQGEI